MCKGAHWHFSQNFPFGKNKDSKLSRGSSPRSAREEISFFKNRKTSMFQNRGSAHLHNVKFYVARGLQKMGAPTYAQFKKTVCRGVGTSISKAALLDNLTIQKKGPGSRMAPPPHSGFVLDAGPFFCKLLAKRAAFIFYSHPSSPLFRIPTKLTS